MNRFFFLPIIFSVLIILSFNSAFAVASLTIAPTSGVVGSTITASGTGFTATTTSSQTHNFQAATSTGFNVGKIWLQKFTALPAGKQLSALHLAMNSNGTTNSTLEVSSQANGHSAGFTGNIYVDKFVLPPNTNVTQLTIDTFSASGSLRLKVYDADGGSGVPGTLLLDGTSQSATASGIYNFPSPIKVGPTGIIYAGFELTLATPANIYYCNGGGCGATTYQSTHVYGTGSNPMTSPTLTADHPHEYLRYLISNTYVRVKAYQDDGAGGGPHTLLGQSGPQLIGNRSVGSPDQNFTISATIPGSGNIWVGFEDSVNGSGFGPIIKYTNNGVDKTNSSSHTFGSGPNPISTVNSFDNPFMKLWYHPATTTVNLYFDGLLQTTSPTPVITDASGAFSGVTFPVPSLLPGSHLVQAIDSSSLSDSKNFVVTANTLPYVTDLHYIALSNNAVSLSWSTPPMNNHTTFHGYQIRYTTPYGTPNTILVNNTNSSSTAYNIAGLLSSTQYSFQIGTWANSTDFYSLANILNFQTLAVSPPNLTPGHLNFTVGTNPLHVGYQFFRQNINTTAINLFVSYPTTYNTTCNLNYEFANTNHTYNNLSTVANGTGRVKANFQFINLNNEIVNTVCRDINTNDTGHYTITNGISNIPLVQQVQNFENGVYGTAGQFGAFDLIELIVIILSTIALNRVDERVGAIVMIFVLGGLAYFHIGSFPVIIFGALAVVILLIIGTGKKLDFTP